MKNFRFVIGSALLFGFAACNSSSSEKDVAKQHVDELSQYVDSVDKATPVYTVANWTAIDHGYEVRVATAEKDEAMLEADAKAKAAASKAQYAALKSNYEAKLKEKEAEAMKPDYRTTLRNNLFGEGKIGADMKFGYVTANNIKDVYENFVNTVADHKNDYSREDWDEIKVLYEALDTRKNEVEKDLATKDNLRIAGLKIKFAAIKATHRGGSKVEENIKAKE